MKMSRPKRTKKKDSINFGGMDSEIDDDRDSTFDCSSGDFHLDSDDSYSEEMQNHNNNNKKSKTTQSTKTLTTIRTYRIVF